MSNHVPIFPHRGRTVLPEEGHVRGFYFGFRLTGGEIEIQNIWWPYVAGTNQTIPLEQFISNAEWDQFLFAKTTKPI